MTGKMHHKSFIIERLYCNNTVTFDTQSGIHNPTAKVYLLGFAFRLMPVVGLYFLPLP